MNAVWTFVQSFLFVQGIVGLSAYVTLLQARGRSEDEIAKYQKLITGFVSYWTSKALSKV